MRAARMRATSSSFRRPIRRPIGPHYWPEAEFEARLRNAGFTVLDLRRTFFDDVSLLAWVRKDSDQEGG